MCKLHYNVIIEKRNRHQEYLELTIPDFITVRIFKQLSQVFGSDNMLKDRINKYIIKFNIPNTFSYS